MVFTQDQVRQPLFEILQSKHCITCRVVLSLRTHAFKGSSIERMDFPTNSAEIAFDVGPVLRCLFLPEPKLESMLLRCQFQGVALKFFRVVAMDDARLTLAGPVVVHTKVSHPAVFRQHCISDCKPGPDGSWWVK
ncbi:hypothetical protein D3C80_1681350 [compost metagenome]